MFTGIVQAMARVTGTKATSAGARLVIELKDWQPREGRIGPGDSICISGVCLTVAACEGASYDFDVIPETLSRTTLGSLAVGDPVNVEPSLTIETLLGGHFVQGHVDGVGTVRRPKTEEGEVRLAVEPPPELLPFIVPKGSITLDGVSLTVAAVGEGDLEVALIPSTLELTTLGRAHDGTQLNIETDIITRTVVHTLHRMSKGDRGITLNGLRRSGFVRDNE